VETTYCSTGFISGYIPKAFIDPTAKMFKLCTLWHLIIFFSWLCVLYVQIVATATSATYRTLVHACAGYLSSYSPSHVSQPTIS